MSDDSCPPDPPGRRELIERVRLEQTRRWLAGDCVLVETLLDTYPALRDSRDAVLDLIYAEVLLRERCGEKPSPDEYIRRFPELTAELGRQFAVHQAIGATPDAPPRILPNPSSPQLSDSVARVVLPGYEVMSEVGRGAFGVVYKARQTALDRIVAVKVILTQAEDEAEQRQRFRREAEAVANLRHPNIVQLYTVGEHAGHLFLVLEYVEGGNLAQRFGGATLNPEQAARLVESVARAVHACHEQGVIHRDLKPANILLGPAGVPKVTDFGLARRAEGTPHTRSGAVLGTPSYMAPEQAEGQSKRVGRGADIYALGAILYELLTGKPPFLAETALDTLVLVLSEEPLPPSRIRLDVPLDLETVCLRCLQKQASHRYASALDLAEDLGRFLRGERTLGKSGVVRSPGANRLSSRLYLLGLLAVAGLVVTVVILGMRPGSREPLSSDPNVPSSSKETEGEGPGHKPEPRPGPTAVTVPTLAPSGMAALGVHVVAVAFADGDKAFACAGIDGSLRLFDTTTATEVRRLDGHPRRIRGMAISPDGKQLASCGDDGFVRLWDVSSGKMLAAVDDNRGPIHSVAFAPPAGKQIASGDASGSIWVRDVPKMKQLRSFNLGGGPVRCLAFAPDGLWLAAGGSGRRAKLWWTDTGQEFFAAGDHRGGVQSLAFSPEGATFVVAGGEGAASDAERAPVLWETAAGVVRMSLPAAGKFASALIFSSDGRLLCVLQEETVRVFAVPSGKEIVRCEGRRGRLSCLAFGTVRPILLAGSEDGAILSWDLSAQTKEAMPSADAAKDPWQALAGTDGVEAHKAVWSLVGSPDQAVKLIARQVRSAKKVEAEALGLQLGAGPEARKAGLAELERAGEGGESVVRQLLTMELPDEVLSRLKELLPRLRKPVQNADQLRALRALEVLEHIGSPAALEQIGELKKDAAPDALLTRRAGAAIRRYHERLLYGD